MVMVHCRTCNTIVHPKALMCSKCGFPPLVGYSHCQKCGGDTTEGQVGCLSCGFALESQNPPTTYSGDEGKEMLKRYCRNCGHEVHSEAVVCVKCGFPPRKMDRFCQSCAAETKSGQMLCTSCGIQLANEKGFVIPRHSVVESSANSKSKLTAGLLAIFLGQLGVHKFYLGYTTPAMVVLLCTLQMSAISFSVGMFTWGIGMMMFIPIHVLVWVFGVIEGIRYLTKTDQEFNETYVNNKREWF